jgi:hypothetical protein
LKLETRTYTICDGGSAGFYPRWTIEPITGRAIRCPVAALVGEWLDGVPQGAQRP